MRRVCFLLQVRTERIEEYRTRHAAVWPEMLRALRLDEIFHLEDEPAAATPETSG